MLVRHLSADDVEQEVGTATATQHAADEQTLVEQLQLLQHHTRWPPCDAAATDRALVLDRQTDNWMDRLTDTWTDEQAEMVDRHMDRKADGHMDTQTNR